VWQYSSSKPLGVAQQRDTRSLRVAVACLVVLCFLLTPGSIAAQSHAPNPSSAPENFATLSAKADAARDADRLDQAISLYRRALALRPFWAEGWWSLGTLEYDKDQFAKATIAFQKMIALQPQNGTAQAMLGLCEFERGRDQPALQHIQKGKNLGLQKNPDLWHVVLFHEGILLQRKGSYQAAQDTLEELCLQAGPSDKVANILGMSMLRLPAKDPPPPGSPDADVVLRVGRAECLAGQKKYDLAQPIFDEAVKLNPSYPNIHYAYGLFLFEIRDVTNGVEQLKQEISNQPDDVVARLRIAAGLYKENSSSAIPYAEEAVKLDPKQPFGHYLLGLLRLDVDDYKGAIPELEIAEKGLPRESKIYAALGTAYSRAGRRQEAAQARATFARLTQEEKKKSATENQPETRESRPEHITVGDLPPAKQ
jgi:tetratricopeptide (TPR) repeat protein